MQKKKVHLPFFFFGLICIAIASVLIWNIGRGFLDSRGSGVIQATNHRIEIAIPASGFVAKSEHLFFSPEEGKIDRIEDAGELLRMNSEVMYLHKGPGVYQTITNPVKGLLTYINDECEQKYTLENLEQLLLKEILEPLVKQSRVANNINVKAGDFIYKIVENDVMHLVLVVNPQYSDIIQEIMKDSFADGKDVNFRIENPTNLILSGNILRTEDREKNHLLVVFSTPYYIDVLLNERKVSGFFTFGYVTASLLPQSSVLVDDNGQHYVIESKNQPEKIHVELLGLDPFTQHYIVKGLEASQSIYINAKQWVELLESS